MRPNSIKTMNEFMESLCHLFDAGDDFGKAFIQLGKAYVKYQCVIWVEGYDNLKELLNYTRETPTEMVFEDHGSYCSISHKCRVYGRSITLHDRTTYCAGKPDTQTSNCPACGSPTTPNGGCTSAHCSSKHDSVESS